MKKWNWTKFVGLFGLVLLPMFLWVGVARAQSFRTGESTTVAANEVVDSSLYAAGRTVDIAGEVNGDVFCAGQNITISGKVNGDIICAAQTVNISGTVTGDVRVAGQTVTVAGAVDGNLSAASQSFSLGQEGKVGQDATIGGNDVTLNGSIGRDLVVGGSTVVLAHTVGRNVTADSNGLSIHDQARVNGNLTYTSAEEASIAAGAQIAGATTHNERAPQENKGSYGQVFAIGVASIIIIVSLVVSSLVLVLLFPATFHAATRRAQGDPLKTFLTGLLASFAVPVLAVALMMTIIGIPLGLLLLFAWLLVLILSGPFFSYFVGRSLLKKQTNPIPIMLIGALVVKLALFVPILGVAVLLAIIWLGSGIVLRELYHRTPKPVYEFKK
jgi:cytoskeletal protein CcmA (bactofilin family)